MTAKGRQMSKSISKQTLGMLMSVILLIITIGGFFYLWSSSKPAEVTSSAIDQKYQKIEISGLVTDAQSLIANRQNAGNLPVLPPATDKVGRENPFAGL